MKKIGYPNFARIIIRIIILWGVLIILFGCASLKAKQEGTVSSSPPGATVYFQEATTNRKLPIGRTPTYAWATRGSYDFWVVAELEGYQTEKWLVPKSGPINYHFQLTKRGETNKSTQIIQQFEPKEIPKIVQKESEGVKEPQGVRITLQEGVFIIKGLKIVQERYRSTKLMGSVLNNTQKDWIKVSFKVSLYDRTGSKLKVGILKEEEFELSFYGIKRGEEKQIGSGYGGTLYDLKDQVARIEVQFKEGEYPAKYSFAMTKPQENKELVFDDKFLRIAFAVSKKQIGFNLRNKTDNPIKIDWNQVSYVDVSGKSHKVMHEGVKYASRNEPQAPTIIPPTAQLDDMVFPTDHAYFSSGKYGGWVDIPLFPEAPAAKHYKNKLFSVFKPLDINGTIKNYLFTFKIVDVEM